MAQEAFQQWRTQFFEGCPLAQPNAQDRMLILMTMAISRLARCCDEEFVETVLASAFIEWAMERQNESDPLRQWAAGRQAEWEDLVGPTDKNPTGH
jgi:hypothetical protein